MKKNITFLLGLMMMVISPQIQAISFNHAVFDQGDRGSMVTHSSFKTQKSPSAEMSQTLYLDEHFESMPDTWSITGDDYPSIYTDNWRYFSGSVYSGTVFRPSTDDTYTLTSPLITFGTLGGNLSFRYKKSDAASVYAVYAEENGVRDTLFTNLPESDDWTTLELSMTNYGGRAITLVFEHSNISGTAYLDDVKLIEPPLCPPVQDFSIQHLTSSSATLTWDHSIANEYNVLICSAPQVSPENPNTSEVIRQETISVLPSMIGVYSYTLNTLTEGTSYYVYLRPDCTNMAKFKGEWSEGFRLQTPCGLQVSPYSEDFDSNNEGEAPSCWIIPSTALEGTAVSGPVEGDTTNSFKLVNDMSQDCMVALPMIDEDISNLMFTFKGKATKENLSMSIGLTQDIADISSMVTTSTVNMTKDWEDYTICFNNTILTTGHYYVVLYVPSGLTEEASSYAMYLDNVAIRSLPSCLYLTDLAVDNITTSSCDISWVDHNASVVDYTVEYTAEGGVPQSVQATSSPFTLSGLVDDTSYAIRVKANCSSTDDSEYTTPVLVNTKFIPKDLSSISPILENFEDGDCDYHFISGSETCFWAVGEAMAYSPSHSMYIAHGVNSDIGVPSEEAYTTTYAYSEINVLEAGKYNLSFMWKGNGNSGVNTKIYVAPDTFLPLAGSKINSNLDPVVTVADSIDIQATAETAWEMINVELNFDTPQVYRLIFELNSHSSTYNADRFIALDDIAIKKVMCDYPTMFATGQKTDSSVELSWLGSSDSYEIYAFSQKKKLGDLELSTAIPDFTFLSNTNSVTCTGLQDVTTYYFYVRGHCGTYLSSWVGPVKVTTSCMLKDLPYFNDFESEVDGSSPMCFEGSSSLNTLDATPSSGFKVNDTQVLCMNGSINEDDILLLPEFSSPLNLVELEFDYSPEETAYSGDLQVGYVSDISDMSTMVTLSTISSSGGKQHVLVDYTSLPPTTSGRMALILKPSSSTSFYNTYGVGIDNILVYEKPDCTPIFGFCPMADVFDTKATVSWNIEAGSARDFSIEYGSKDFIEGTGTSISVTDTFCVLTGLMAQTEYTIRVKRNCGSLGVSTSKELTFCTVPALAMTDNYRCDFEDSTENSAWVLTNMSSQNSWEIGTQTNHGGSSALYIVDSSGDLGYDSGTASDAFVSRYFQFTQGIYTLSFDYLGEGESTYDYMKVVLIPGSYQFTPNVSNGLSLQSSPETWIQGPKPYYNGETEWTTASYTLNVPADNVYTLAFYWKNDASMGSNPAAEVDNISIKKQTCFAAKDFDIDKITTDSATISWTNLAADHAQIRLDTIPHSLSEVDQVTNWYYSSDLCTAQSVALGGLSPNTTYYLRVRNICSATDSAAWSEEYSFTTMCGLKTLPYFENFDAFDANVIPQCWTNLADGLVNVNISHIDEKPEGLLYLKALDAETIKLAFPQMNFTDPIEDYYMSFKLKTSSLGSNAASISFIVTSTLGSNEEYKLRSEDLSLTDADTDWHWYSIHFEHPTDPMTGQAANLSENQFIEMLIPGAATIYMDSIQVSHEESCITPYDVVVDSVLSSSAKLSWHSVAERTEIEYINQSKIDSSGALIPDTMRVTTNMKTYKLTGLVPNSLYKFRLRSYCSATEHSSWSHSESFTTDCGEETLPYTMDFESLDANALTRCWDFNSSSLYKTWESGMDYDGTISYFYQFGSDSRIYSDYSASMTTPVIDLESATYSRLSFEVLSSDVSNTQLMLCVDDIDAGTRDTLLTSVLLSESWNTQTLGLQAYVGHKIRVGFYAALSYGCEGYVQIDHLVIEDALYVEKPLNVFVDDITQHSVMAHVTPQANISDYNFAVMTSEENFDETTANIVSMSGKDSVLIPALVAGTAYKLYAQSRIGEQFSSWAGPVYFFTSCATVSAPVYLSLENEAISPCWSVSGVNHFSTDTVTTGAQSYALGATGLLISPEIIDPLSTLDVYLHAFTAQSSQILVLGVMSDSTDLSTKVPLDTISSTSDFSKLYKISLALAPAMAHYVYVENRSTSDFVYLDDLSIETSSSCEMNAVVTLEDILPSTACVRMSDPSVVYDLVWGESNVLDVVTANPLLTSVGDSTTITGLKSNTIYNLYVRTHCDQSSSHWYGPYSFTSACSLYTVSAEEPYIENLNSVPEASTYLKKPDCWTMLNNSGTNSVPMAYMAINYYGGGNYLRMNPGLTDSVYAITPSFSNDLSELMFSMSIMGTYSADYPEGDILTLGVMSDPLDASTFQALKTVDLSGLSAYTYHDFTFDCRYSTISPDKSYFALRMRNASDNVKLNNFRIDYLGSCVEPTIALVSSTETSATIHLDYASMAESFDIAVNSDDGTYSDTTYNVTADSLYTVMGLSANNLYTIMARTHCLKNGVTSLSGWSNAVTCVTMAQAHVGFPYFCGFEDNTENTLWSMSRGGLTNYWVVGTSAEAVKEGTNALYITCDSTNSAVPLRSYEVKNQKTFTWAARKIHFEPGAYHIAFKVKSGGERDYDYLRAFLVDESQALVPCNYDNSDYDTFSGTTLTKSNIPNGFIDLLETHYLSLSDWQEINADIIVPETTDYQLAFLWRNDLGTGDSLGVTIDSISITRNLCALPTALTMVDIADTMATATATGLGINPTIDLRYVVVLRDSALIPTNIIAEVMGHAGDTVSLAGLAGSTDYDLYCTRVCEGVPQEWMDKTAFKTLVTLAQVPYSCGFESTDDSAQWIYRNDNNNGWMIGDATANTGTQSLYISNDHSANTYTTSSSQISYAYRTVHFSQGEYVLSFDWKAKGESSFDFMYCFVVPASAVPTGGNFYIDETYISSHMDNPTDGYTFGYFNMQTTWQTAVETFMVNEDCDMNVVFCWRNDGSGGENPAAAVDNISITASSCPAPFNVQATEISSHDALLTWEGDAMSYILQIEDESDSMLIDTTLSDTSFRVTGLHNGYSYSANVRSICSPTDSSTSASAYEFNTNCGTFSIPFFEGFEGSSTTPHCWSQATGLVVKGDTTLGSSISGTVSGWSHVTSPQPHDFINVYGTTVKNWLMTPELVLDSSLVLMFDAALTDYGNWNVIETTDLSDDRFVVMITRDHGVHWTEYAVWDNTQAVGHRYKDLTNDFVKKMVPITPESTQDTIQLAFYAESTITGADNNLHLDNISLSHVISDTVYYTDTICQGTLYGRYGFNIPGEDVATGQYQTLLLKGVNQDTLEVHLLDLFVNPSYAMDTMVTICHGQSYPFGGLDLSETGYYRQNLTSASGCDSLINLSLVVTMLQTDIDTMLCEGQSITLGSQTITTSGVYTDTLRNAQGCDSLINLSVWIIPTTTNLVDTICEGSFAEIGSTQYTTSGVYTGTLKNVLGCDSVVNLDLTVIPVDSMMTGTMCVGGEYAFFGTILNKGGFYTDTIHNYLNTGCDRIYKLTLTETLPDTVEIADQYCEGMSSYNQYGFNINDPETKDYIKNLTSMVTGCDSVTILHLSEVKTVYSAFDYTMCDGEAYDFGGSNYYVSGVYEHTFLASSTNCDSVVTLTLKVNPTYEQDLAVSIAENKLPYTNLDLTVPAGTEEGTYDYRIEAKTMAGCDSIINLTLTVTPPDGLSQVQVHRLDVVPNVVKRGGTVTIKTSFSDAERRGMDIRLYDAVGHTIKIVKPTLAGDQQVTMPAVSGAYFLRITTTNGVTYSTKILVF